MRVLRPGDSLAEMDRDSIFLAGPTPRSDTVASWRPSAISHLKQCHFTGDVLAPEPFVGSFDEQVAWEYQGLENCRLICFWLPRDLISLPGFTTNIEFGRYVDSGRCLYGRPNGAPKTKYLDWLYSKLSGKKPFPNLSLTFPRCLTTRCCNDGYAIGRLTFEASGSKALLSAGIVR